MTTLGVEEEYLLVDPVTGLPRPMAVEVKAAAGADEVTERGEVQRELLQAQVEVATPVCAELAEVGGHLLRLRHAVAAAAEDAGCRVLASGAAPVRDGQGAPVTPERHFLRLRGRRGRLVDEQLVNGMHVHVGIPDRAAGTAALNRVRAWLPLLVAMGGNSPMWCGQDTGYASWRTIVESRWPVSGPPPEFADDADYDARMRLLVDVGAIEEVGQVAWEARLSHRYPTLEVRCCDVQLTADDAVMFAGISRGLVATALREEADGVPLPDVPQELLNAANWHAARYGLDGHLIDPPGRRQRPAGELVGALLDHIAPALDEHGDTREVTGLVERFLRTGGPAGRQREALADGGLPMLLDLLCLRHAGR
ncbi:carboxylate-amine ligase [Streptomyces caatingaensis]|uniref:Putative glutamate--cysteine ligase 2 n=1 Tax=Streptomyces caatingaensis TaxID=1678637 RepID=A0A0K9XMG6_9ACTN|nr:glutamate--cysteine ligase [Streptomyces caatingaensis]KNB54291.1 carboxylate--amine ligase [Streptomyces caatingaensis]